MDGTGDKIEKHGSGYHALYVVPSLDLVVWKLGGRDGQYGVQDTGLPEIPTEETRSDWSATVAPDAAYQQTLRLVVDAIVD